MFLSNITLHAHVRGSTTASAKLRASLIFTIAFSCSKVHHSYDPMESTGARHFFSLRREIHRPLQGGLRAEAGVNAKYSGLPPRGHVARQSRR
jgi:hypothetical protein